MAVTRSDIIIPEVFTPYLIEATTQRDAFLQSGIVQPMAELNALQDGGDYVQVPFYKANLAGDFEVLTDATSMTPGKITADKQMATVLHRGRSFESRDLAALAAGNDPMAAIGDKLATYIAHQRQKDVLACLDGVFGPLQNNAGKTDASADGQAGGALFDMTVGSALSEFDEVTDLNPNLIVKAKALLGDQGENLSAMVIHPDVYYDLVQKRAIDFVYDSVGKVSGSATQGSLENAYGTPGVPTYMGMRVIVSQDVQKKKIIKKDAVDFNTFYANYLFTPGSIGSGEQLNLKTETDRDILALSDVMAVSAHYIYHPIGTTYQPGKENPGPDGLADETRWRKVYDSKNIGIVRITTKSTIGTPAT